MVISVKWLQAPTLLGETLEREPTSIEYRDIRRATERLGWLESALEIDAGGTTIRLTSMRRKGARAAAEAIRRHAPVPPGT